MNGRNRPWRAWRNRPSIWYTLPKSCKLCTCFLDELVVDTRAFTECREVERPMVASAVDGIDLFKVAGRSISGWIPMLVDLVQHTLDRKLPLALLSSDAAPLVSDPLPDTLLVNVSVVEETASLPEFFVLSIPAPALLTQVDEHSLELYVVTPDGITVVRRVHMAVLVSVKTAAILGAVLSRLPER